MAAATKKGQSEDAGGITFPQLKREWRQWEGTDTQVESGFRCYVRPNRSTKRTFDAKSAARAVCAAIKHGTPKTDIDKAVREKCLPGRETQCDCDEVYNTLLLVAKAAVAISIILAISRVAQIALPVILATVIIRFLPSRIALLLGGARSVIRQLPDASRTIEGVFFRVNETVRSIQRQNPGTISSSGVRG